MLLQYLLGPYLLINFHSERRSHYSDVSGTWIWGRDLVLASISGRKLSKGVSGAQCSVLSTVERPERGPHQRCPSDLYVSVATPFDNTIQPA